MSKFDNLFGMNEKMGTVGFLSMWLSFFTTSFVVLLVDDTQGPARDFCFMSQLLCCSNVVSMGWAIANNVNFTKASFYTLHFDTFGTLLALAYYGGGDVMNSSTLGAWNTVQVVGTVMNAVYAVASLYMVARDHKGFSDYLNKQTTAVIEQV